MLDAASRLVEGLGEEGGLVLFVGLVGDDWSDAARPCCRPVCLAGIALVSDGGARGNIWPDVEQGLEVGAIGGFAAGQIESDQVSATIGFCVDFGREPALRATERLAVLPPFAPAAETCARTIVESNIWIRCAVGLIAASVSKKASNTPALLNRSNRFHTVFQFPYSLGSARQRTFSTVKKCSASKNRRSSAALRPRRGKHARNTSKVCAQSSSLIFVDIVPTPSVSRNPMNHLRFNLGIGKSHLSTIRPHGLAGLGVRQLQAAILGIPVARCHLRDTMLAQISA